MTHTPGSYKEDEGNGLIRESRLMNTEINHVRPRKFKCPECDGEFDHWEEHPNPNTVAKQCPFCLTEKGTYDSQ